ncbi:hypothetical protein ACC691_41300, partial [Rhizobium johnstonii]|uniref:hypothetical protein n=1 Tax=Rhizobium johnstonii TaxID=3019933 RepID=UPI003F99126D
VEHVRIAASFAVRGPQITRVGVTLAHVRDLLARILAAGAADGSLRSDIPTETIAHLIEQAAIAVLNEAMALFASQLLG